MHKTIHKAFFLWQFEQEEAWLAKMSADGWALVSVSPYTYHFESCEPGRYIVRLELVDSLIGQAGRDYIGFLEGTGAKHLGNVFRWVYFRRETADGPFALFSDLDSKIAHLNRVICLITPFILLTAGIGLVNLFLHPIPNRVIGGICLAAAALLGCGLAKILQMRAKPRRDRQLYE